MKIRRLFALLLCLLMLLQTVPVQSDATQANPDKNYNIMIVMDCSGSLVNPEGILSDPQGYRYEATSMFLDLLSDSGNNVGAIVFNSTISTSDCSDTTMRECLQLDTGLLPMNSVADKENLMQQIRSIEPNGFTDIGTALLAAAEQLKGMEAKNGLESIIILFTDGATETYDRKLGLAEQPVYAQSLKNRDAAVELIREEDITLCGVYLRREKVDLENNEVLRLVRDANGFDPTAKHNQVGGLFVHVQEADTLANAFQQFYTIISGTGAKSFEGEKTFRIPGAGVDDINITVNLRGATLEQCSRDMENLKVTLVRPGNIEYTPQELAAITSLGTNYAVYKIHKPEAGQWNVRVECPGAQIQSSILLNTSVRAEVSFSAAPEELQVNKPFTATARLLRSGEPLAGSDAYKEYTCTLVVQNAKTEEEWPVQMYYDETANAFTAPLYVQAYGEYYAHAEFTCGDSVKLLTPDQYWIIHNERPVVPAVQEVHITQNHLFSAGTAQLNLIPLVTDKEDDPEKIEITVDPGNYPSEAWKCDGKVLYLDGAIGGNGSVTVIFTDTAGAQSMTEVRIVYINNMLRNMIIFAAITAVILVLLAVIWFKHWTTKRIGGKLPGVLKLTLPLTNSDFVPLTVEAQSCVQQDLYAVLKTHRIALVDNALDRCCTENDVDMFLYQFSAVLSGVKITAIQDKKSRDTICRLSGLPGPVSQVDIRKDGRANILLPDCDDKIILEYNRYQ